MIWRESARLSARGRRDRHELRPVGLQFSLTRLGETFNWRNAIRCIAPAGPRPARVFACVPSMIDSLEVEVLYPA